MNKNAQNRKRCQSTLLSLANHHELLQPARKKNVVVLYIAMISPIKRKRDATDSDGTGMTDSKTNDDDDGAWCEVEDRPSGVTDTLLQEPDMTKKCGKDY